MRAAKRRSLGLVVRSAPFARRSARDDLDVALAAATLEVPLEIFFVGSGVMQLAADRDVLAALLPHGLGGWAALGDLTEIRYFAEPGVWRRIEALGIDTTVRAEPLEARAMAERWRQCARMLVL